MTCDEGFEIKGLAFKACGGTRNGVWSQKNKIPRCIDVTPPNIVCPRNYSIELNGNKSFILLASFEPLELVEGRTFNAFIFPNLSFNLSQIILVQTSASG